MTPNSINLRSARMHSIKRSISRSFFVKPAVPPAALPVKAPIKSASFVFALVHEIKNPLTSINLALEMLFTTNLDAAEKEYLEIIKRGAGRIKNIVNDLCIHDQTDEASFAFHSPRQLIDAALLLTRDQLMLKKITVHQEFTGTDRKILMDKEKMTIALTNIIINAIEAMPVAKGVLRLVAGSTPSLYTIEIHDNGIGISTTNLEKIFDPYFTNKPGGFGIGLSATLDILRANHVAVHVRSEERRGTCFTLSSDHLQPTADA